MRSLFRAVRRLGWAGLKRRFELGRADFVDWYASRHHPRHMRIGLQPWRLGKLPPRFATLDQIGERVAAPTVSVLGVVEGKAPPTVMRSRSRFLYRATKAIVMTHHVILKRGRRQTSVIPWSLFHRPEYNHRAILTEDGDAWYKYKLTRGTPRRVRGPVLLVDSMDYEYGHVLLEMIPRLSYLKLCPPETRVITSLKMTRNYFTLFEAMGVAPERVEQFETPVYCDELYFGDSSVDLFKFVTPSAWECFARLGKLAERSSIETHDRIYISRRGIKRRTLLNEEEIENLFRKYGFTIIAPEARPIEDQIKLFANASMIAGPRGSGMHNNVFSRPDAKLLLLTFKAFTPPIDTFLMRQDGTLSYVVGERQDKEVRTFTHSAPWLIDPALVEQGIREHFGL